MSIIDSVIDGLVAHSRLDSRSSMARPTYNEIIALRQHVESSRAMYSEEAILWCSNKITVSVQSWIDFESGKLDLDRQLWNFLKFESGFTGGL